ncbi:MAG: MFS transporter [Jatrophihabitantaceae bacterium]
MPFIFSPDARRDLNLIVAARAVSLLGDEVALVALLLHTQARGQGAWPVAALLTAGMLPLMLLAPLVGRLVDRRDSRTLLVASGLGQLLSCLALALRQDLPVMLVLVAVLGAGQAVNSVTWQALLPRVVGVAALPAALGRSQAWTTAAGILAPAIGGLLSGRFGVRLPLLLDAVTFAAITLAAIAVRTRRPAPQPQAIPDNRGGWSVLRADPVLLRLVLMLSLFILLGSMVNVIEVFLVRQSLHASATWYGVLGAAWGVGVLGGALGGGRLSGQRSLSRASLGSCLLLAFALAAMGLAPSIWWVVPGCLVGGSANGLLSVSAGALIGIRTSEAHRGRMAATVTGLTSASQVGAMLLGGLLAAVLAPRLIFVLAGTLGAIAPLVLGPGLLAAAPARNVTRSVSQGSRAW